MVLLWRLGFSFPENISANAFVVYNLHSYTPVFACKDAYFRIYVYIQYRVYVYMFLH